MNMRFLRRDQWQGPQRPPTDLRTLLVATILMLAFVVGTNKLVRWLMSWP